PNHNGGYHRQGHPPPGPRGMGELQVPTPHPPHGRSLCPVAPPPPCSVSPAAPGAAGRDGGRARPDRPAARRRRYSHAPPGHRPERASAGTVRRAQPPPHTRRTRRPPPHPIRPEALGLARLHQPGAPHAGHQGTSRLRAMGTRRTPPARTTPVPARPAPPRAAHHPHILATPLQPAKSLAQPNRPNLSHIPASMSTSPAATPSHAAT